MHTRLEHEAADGPALVSTGRVPSPERVTYMVAEA
jgi:hypothetical protein